MVQKTATSAGAVILREVKGQIKIALAHHARPANSWALPKGHVEDGESLQEAALREVYEETGLSNVQMLRYLGSMLRASAKSNGDVIQKTIHFYLAYSSSQPKAPTPTDQKFVEAGWFSPKEAIRLLPSESDQNFLREHLELLF
jgi:8-oxo-dGTP pyrophosphatase MutT (NUDIX family)